MRNILITLLIITLFGCTNEPSSTKGQQKLEIKTIKKPDVIKEEQPSLTSDENDLNKPKIENGDLNANATKLKIDSLNRASQPDGQLPELKQLAATQKTSKGIESDEKKVIKKKAVKKKAVKKKKRRKKKSRSKAIITFAEPEFNYGRIKPGDVVKHDFKFKNEGKGNLIISNAIASCGCTTPSFPFIPIEPGKEGYIGVIFDSTGKVGKQRPSITLTTNVGKKKIYLTGYVYDKLMNE